MHEDRFAEKRGLRLIYAAVQRRAGLRSDDEKPSCNELWNDF